MSARRKSTRRLFSPLQLIVLILLLLLALAALWVLYTVFSQQSLPEFLVQDTPTSVPEVVQVDLEQMIQYLPTPTPTEMPWTSNALLLRGPYSHVYVPDNDSLDTETAITLEAWVQTGDGVSAMAIISRYEFLNGDQDDTFYLGMYQGRVVFQINTGNDFAALVGSGLISDSTWHHLAAVWDGYRMLLYIDGQLDAELEYIGSGHINRSDQPVIIGLTLEDGQPARGFHGQLDEIRIWHTVRTPAALDELRFQALTGNEYGLLAYWPFHDPPTLEVAQDQSPRGNHGAVAGGAELVESTLPLDASALQAVYRLSVTPTPEVVSPVITSTPEVTPTLEITEEASTSWAEQSLSLDGSRNFAVVMDHDSLDGVDALTLEAWVRTRDQVNTMAVIARYDPSLDPLSNAYFLYIQEGRVVFQVYAGETFPLPLTSRMVVADDAWHHLAAVWDGQEMSIYIDGVLNVKQNFNPEGSIHAVKQPLYIGRSQAASASQNFFSGEIDEVRIWNIARSAKEIVAAMYAPLLGDEAGLVAYFPMNRGPAGLAVDIGPNKLDGRLLGGAALVNSTVPEKPQE